MSPQEDLCFYTGVLVYFFFKVSIEEQKQVSRTKGMAKGENHLCPRREQLTDKDSLYNNTQKERENRIREPGKWQG